MKLYAVNYYLRGFGHATFQVRNARDVLDAVTAVVRVLNSRSPRTHIEDYSINGVNELFRIDESDNHDRWPVIDAKEENV